MIVAIITYGVSSLFVVNSGLLQLIINVIVCCIVPNLILYILFRKTDNFTYFKNLMFNAINKVSGLLSKSKNNCN